MLKAAIDIGTNSTRLFIADVDKGIKRVEKQTVITRLGKKVDKEKRLGAEGIERNINVLKEYKRICQSYGTSEILAIATSAVRDAINRSEFVDTIKRETGIDIKVISGELEAELGFIGASSVVKKGHCLVCDIGGGSTELILGYEGAISKAQSIDIGSVRMTERFAPHGNVDDNSIENAHQYIKSAVKDTIDNIKAAKDITLVGIGGTVTTLAAIDQELAVYDIDKVHGYKLTKQRVDSIFSTLINMSLEERYNIPGLQKERADVIPMGTLILKTVMEELGLNCIIVSERDNLDGILLKQL